MRIKENTLYITYDPSERELSTYRLIDGTEDKIILTKYPLDVLRGKGFKEAGRLIGEDILLSITGTRDLFT
jgi:hypothetical protein